jgi:hypothetical protein
LFHLAFKTPSFPTGSGPQNGKPLSAPTFIAPAPAVRGSGNRAILPAMDEKTAFKSPAPPTASDQRDKLVKHQIEMERAATDAKTAKLKALRLAKEAEEKASAPPPSAKPARKPRR